MPELKIDKNSSLNYRLIPGDMDKPHLVFLHEGLGCEAMWKGFPELLCKTTGCPGLIYDRLGHGKSSPLNRKRTVHFMHEYALVELPKLLEELIPDTPFILIGHSDGGSIALIYAAERPPFLKGIVAEAAHVFVEQATIEGIRNADEAWKKGKLKGLAKYHGRKTPDTFEAWARTWLSNWFQHWNIEYLLPSIEVPLLVIQGTEDQYGSIDQANSIVSKSSAPARLEILDNCAHAPHLEASSTTLKLMSNFINQIN